LKRRDIAAELFRRTNKALTITGYSLDPAIRELQNVDKVFDWAMVWGERHKAAAAAEQATANNGNGFDSSGCKYSIDEIERIVREGPPTGANRSDVFHAIVGHFVGCGWTADRIFEHLQEHPQGVGGRYIAEDRLRAEVVRSAGKFAQADLPQFEVKAPPEPEPEHKPPPEHDPELDGDEDLDEEAPEQDDPNLPPLHVHGKVDNRPLKSWLVKGLIPEVGHGLLSGQWSAGKTVTALDLAGSVMTCTPFLGRMIKRQCGVLFVAAESASDVRLRFETLMREKYGGLCPAPFVWYESAPPLLQKDSAKKWIAMARQADRRLKADFGLPLGLVVADSITSCAGYIRAGDDQSNAVGQAIMDVFKAVAQDIHCFVLPLDHFGKDPTTGTRGPSSKEDAAEVILVCLGDRQVDGTVTNTRLAIRKNKAGEQGQKFPFALRKVTVGVDEDGDPITTMVVDWLPPGSAQAPLPSDDPWLEGCRRDDQRVGMSRLKRVFMAALAEDGIERPIPSALHVRTSGTPIETEVRTPSADGPVVRMVDQEIVWEAFCLCTPNDPRQTTHSRFTRARDRAEQRGLLEAGNIDGVTYLWLTRPDPEKDDD
jgi:hypothetical protein